MTENTTTEVAIPISGAIRKNQTHKEDAFLNQVVQLMTKALHDWEQERVAKEKDG